MLKKKNLKSKDCMKQHVPKSANAACESRYISVNVKKVWGREKERVCEKECVSKYS